SHTMSAKNLRAHLSTLWLKGINSLRLPDREQPKLACKWPSLPHVSCQPQLTPFFQVRPVRSSCGTRRLSVAFDRSASRAAQRYQKIVRRQSTITWRFNVIARNKKLLLSI